VNSRSLHAIARPSVCL